MSTRNEQLREEQRAAIWKWRWLGFRKSTPGFKGSLVILTLAALALAVVFVRG